MSIFATVSTAPKESHCVSVTNAAKFNAVVYSSPNSNTLLNPNRYVRKKNTSLAMETDSYFIFLNKCTSNLNFLYCFTVTYKV